METETETGGPDRTGGGSSGPEQTQVRGGGTGGRGVEVRYSPGCPWRLSGLTPLVARGVPPPTVGGEAPPHMISTGAGPLAYDNGQAAEILSYS